MAITFIKRSIRLLVPHHQFKDIPEDEDEQSEIFQIVHFFSQANNFSRYKKQIHSPLSYGEKRKKEEMLMRFTNSYLNSNFKSIEAVRDKFEQVDELMDENGDMAERK